GERFEPPRQLRPVSGSLRDVHEWSTLSLHDALPIFASDGRHRTSVSIAPWRASRSAPSMSILISVGARSRHTKVRSATPSRVQRSEEHTSELQSRSDLVCRLLLEKKDIAF